MEKSKSVLVGLSGGVDSLVTAHLLQKDGYKVKAVFLKLRDDEAEETRAKIAADSLGLELGVFDLRKDFEKTVRSDFIKKYQKGLTPNPCVFCNPEIKFTFLRKMADRLNCEKVATGHYARVECRPENGNKDKKCLLIKAKDESKDQSYFLYRLSAKQLRNILFPLGGLEKAEVKKIAQKNNLPLPKAESQDACFLVGSNLDDFLRNNLSSNLFTPGEIVDEKGEKVGTHRGLLSYTIGQRKGIDVGGTGPFYVKSKDFKKNVLLVTRRRDDLLSDKVVFRQTNWLAGLPEKDKQYHVKIRYQMKPVRATVQRKGSHWEATAQEGDAFSMVTPGQSLVVYDGDVVVGGGVIELV